MGGRRGLHRHGRRLSVLGRGAGRVQPPHCGLGRGYASLYRADAASAGHGAAAAPARGCHPSLGQGLPSTPRSPSSDAVANPAYAPRWARLATRTTTRSAKASSLRSNRSCSHASTSPRAHRLNVPYSRSSRAGTTQHACTAASLTTRPCVTRSCTTKTTSAKPKQTRAPLPYEEVRTAPFNQLFSSLLKRGNFTYPVSVPTIAWTP